MPATVSNAQFLAKLDEYRPEWAAEYADHRDLVEFAQCRITADKLRRRTFDRIWPIANVVWACIVQAERAADSDDGDEPGADPLAGLEGL